MGINLVKGQRLDIGIEKAEVGLGWQANVSGIGGEYDLDASAFMLNADGKLERDEFFVFYNNLSSPDGSVSSSGDDLTGGAEEGDDETLSVDLTKVSATINEIVFVVSIHDAEARKQNFGQVRKSYMRIVDTKTNDEICKYELDEDFSVETCIEFGRLYMHNGKWKFEALGIGHKKGLQELIDKYQ